MVEGKQGLRAWEESAYLTFCNAKAATLPLKRPWRSTGGTAICMAAKNAGLGGDASGSHRPTHWRDWASIQTEIQVHLGARQATKRLSFEQRFNPGGAK